ncbi:MAG TPA: fructose-6-phosphate aldolase [Candidatus Saccharicenans sp.]|jgi:transaldolase|nr:fructose-6-phosphate aldolase [Candidatus Saccharicenans sp.]HRD01625.1 fructose-6-phosphate aldolase [Candidatus Saccharicenans sp.]
MKLFLDTANLSEIKEVASWGILDGVTTNPTLCSKENVPFETLIKDICRMVNGPVSVECISTRAEDIVPEALKLSQMAANIAIKIPVTLDGLKATKILAASGVKVNMTLVFSPSQALLAAKAGAAFVSPFIGRLDDISHHGMELVEQILTVYENYQFETEVIVASIRHPGHVVEAALLGADIATVPYAVMEKLVKHPLTDTGIERFLADWKKVSLK